MKKGDSMNTVIALLSTLLCLSPSFFFSTLLRPYAPTHAQYCSPAIVCYIVRDESGNLLGEAELKSLREQLPDSINDARVSTSVVSFAEDNETYYWSEDVDWKKGRMVPAMEFSNFGECKMYLTEVTLTYKNKTMRLIFDTEYSRSGGYHRQAIDSLPFQEGTFQLDLRGWPERSDKLVPASRWKKVGDKS
jgi:hypothetical protein